MCLGLASCMKIDNWDAPSAHFSGTIKDSYTDKPLVQDQNDWQIRIWEKSWTVAGKPAVASYQSLVTKNDGTYNNDKLFSGTYDMLPYGGPFWPCDTVKGVVLDKATVQDFTVTPFLQIPDITATLVDSFLTITCKVKAPIISKTINTATGPVLTNLWRLKEVKAFISLNNFCGNSNYINISQYNDLRVQNESSTNWGTAINVVKTWGFIKSDASDVNLYNVQMTGFPLRHKYTYNLRVGANVNDANNKYNYSSIIKVVVP